MTARSGFPPALDEVRVVEREGPQDRLLLLVHGYGEPPELLTDHLPSIDPDGRYLAVAPVAPFDKKGRPIWHRAFGGESAEAADQYLHSLALLDDLVEELCAERGFDRADAVVAGFSQGAGLMVGLTLSAGLRGRQVPRGCLAFCGFVPPVPGLAVDLEAASRASLLLLSATDDRFMAVDTSRESADALASFGLAVEYQELEQGHEITPEGAALAGRWLAAVTAGERPVNERPVVGSNGLLRWVQAVWDGEPVVRPPRRG